MTRSQATALALLAALAWGSGNVAQKAIFDHLDGWAATGVTSLVGAMVLLPLAMRQDRSNLTSVKAS